MMKAVELRQKSKEELQELLREKIARKGGLRPLLFQKKIKNVKEFSAVRKDIARINTILNELSGI